MTQDGPITDLLDFFQTGRRGVITLPPKVTNLMDLSLELLAAKEASKNTRPMQKHPWRCREGIWRLSKSLEALLLLLPLN